MSVASFVSASIELLSMGKYDAALALACTAVDATAAKAGKEQQSNNERYKQFLRDNMPIVTRFGFPGIQSGGIRIKCINVPDLKTDSDGYVGIEDILYHTLRCGLVHQCEIDRRIQFTSETYIGDFAEQFKLPLHVITGLLMAVVVAPENKDESTPSALTINIDGSACSLNGLWGCGQTKMLTGA